MTGPRLCPQCGERIRTKTAKVCRFCGRKPYKAMKDRIDSNTIARRKIGESSQEMPGLQLEPPTGKLQKNARGSVSTHRAGK